MPVAKNSQVEKLYHPISHFLTSGQIKIFSEGLNLMCLLLMFNCLFIHLEKITQYLLSFKVNRGTIFSLYSLTKKVFYQISRAQSQDKIMFL